ncbi:reverse transcriptase [Plakobranchus ocellatus]|uniref:Reverse transcriptase n=1 Tax=Plakobranchus ocellatus TaxID=259542 RepID=A0AAV3YGE5_9GAST|nr:reverse transcriptase [Plakobranchus ocellatus]
MMRWGMKDNPTCPLCQGKQTTEDVLSSCKETPSQGRYRNGALHRIPFKCYSTDHNSRTHSTIHTRVEWKRQNMFKRNKREKYKNLSKELGKVGYKSQISAYRNRGFVGTSAYSPLSKLSINSQRRTKALKALAEAAENSSWCF